MMSTLNTPNDPRNQVANPMQEGIHRILPLAAMVLSFAIVATYYGDLPERIPIHWNGRGEIDGYGAKIIAWVLPVVNLGLFWLMGLIANSGYRWFNYPVRITEENAAEQHRIALLTVAVVRTVCCLMFAYITYAMVRSAVTGNNVFSTTVMISFLVLMFGGIIYYYLQAVQAK
ncbi:DUF1648 domain-containing protein [Lewinella sp. W8]|uniref:DUF1648 domain-containing protein n=1 Tax=Lewinella sp. W8 TaxID=2528208 RepID=UPI0010684CF6|nr:DUF1648 domain-containing protein [Lewinella sp. W8]MTB49831.1 DUF1648 domain-containing protein [Lewinella sp. W8]